MNKLRDNYWVNSGVFAISQRLSIPLFGLASFLVLIRTLSEEELGICVIFLSITTILEVARNGLLKAAIVKSYQENKEHRPDLLYASFTLNLVYTLITTSLLLLLSSVIAAFYNSTELIQLFWWYTISAICFCLFTHAEYWYQADMKFKNVFILYFVKQGSFLLCISINAIIVNTPILLNNLVIYQIVSLVLALLSSIGFYIDHFKLRVLLSRPRLLELWSFGRFGFFTNVSNSALTSADHLLLGGLLSKTSVAIYNAAARITNVFIIPSVAIADILYPKAVQGNIKQGTEKVKDLYEKAVGATLLPMIPVFVFLQLFPAFTIKLLAGERYIDAVPVLRISSISIFILPFLKQYGTVVNTLNKPQLNFYFVLALAVVNIGLNYIFISKFGLLGAATATLLSYCIGLIGCQIILKKLANISTLKVLSSSFIFFKMSLNFFSKGIMKT